MGLIKGANVSRVVVDEAFWHKNYAILLEMKQVD